MTTVMAKKLVFGLLLFSLSLLSSISKEPSPSIAVLDMTEVFANHPATELASKELTEAREVSRKTFKEKSNLLKQVLQKHQELIRAGKKEEAAEELKKANEAERAIATLRTTELRDLEEKFRKSKNQIMKDIQKSVAAFNKDGRYALIFDHSSSSSNGLPQVVHAPGAEDITTAVIAFIKKESEKSPPKHTP
tara:strand:+ start:427 stop:1002 length:576 start_codon:yes stop_codon:yes gene_type:complete